eukprot:CAMPEP_0180522090 /NCGR_PEP_ID=MMETSP1036_2-20121128/57218_1 /TAXON_ID=632150 /ORGANISM="Azadinium spinosum, Strain 3D9" /LENGTH=272 /DNA_ID=CAMNT_0022534837 /DNA_START=253 /DNA_END=1071 /DNA_ORIENTATION=+
MKHVLESIKAMRFCFSDVTFIVDVPHGGLLHFNSERTSLSGGPGGYKRFVKHSWGQKMVSTAQKKAQEAVSLLQSHCPLSRRPTWNVDVMNYDDPAMRSRFDLDFDVDVQMDANSSVFGSMYSNTMVYDTLWHHTDAQYVWHQDSDVTMRLRKSNAPSFMETSLALMRSDDRVVFTRPDKPDLTWVPAEGFEEFDAKWPEGSALAPTFFFPGPNGTNGQLNCNAFLMDVQRMRSLLPIRLEPISQDAENFFRHNFQEHGVYQVTISGGLFIR